MPMFPLQSLMSMAGSVCMTCVQLPLLRKNFMVKLDLHFFQNSNLNLKDKYAAFFIGKNRLVKKINGSKQTGFVHYLSKQFGLDTFQPILFFYLSILECRIRMGCLQNYTNLKQISEWSLLASIP
jgi:hypothetical protein